MIQYQKIREFMKFYQKKVENKDMLDMSEVFFLKEERNKVYIKKFLIKPKNLDKMKKLFSVIIFLFFILVLFFTKHQSIKDDTQPITKNDIQVVKNDNTKLNSFIISELTSNDNLENIGKKVFFTKQTKINISNSEVLSFDIVDGGNITIVKETQKIDYLTMKTITKVSIKNMSPAELMNIIEKISSIKENSIYEKQKLIYLEKEKALIYEFTIKNDIYMNLPYVSPQRFTMAEENTIDRMNLKQLEKEFEQSISDQSFYKNK